MTCPALPGLVTYGETLEEARAMAADAIGGYIECLREGCLHLAYQLGLDAFEHDPAALLQLGRRVVARRKRRTEEPSAQVVDATDSHWGTRELAAGKWRCAHLARMFFGGTARIVEHLEATFSTIS